MKRAALLTVFCALAAASAPALAYMGPGAGLGMLGSLFALIGAALVGLFGLIVLPIRLLLKRLRRQPAPPPIEPR